MNDDFRTMSDFDLSQSQMFSGEMQTSGGESGSEKNYWDVELEAVEPYQDEHSARNRIRPKRDVN